MINLVHLKTFETSPAAYLAKAKLNKYGISSAFENESNAQTWGLMGDQMGGIKLMVKKSDAEKAYKILVESSIITPEDEAKKKENYLFADWTEKIPFINKLPIEFRLVSILMTSIVLSMVAIVIVNYTPTDPMTEEINWKYGRLGQLSALVEEDPTKAIIEIDKELIERPTDVDLLQLKGLAHLYLDNYQEAHDYILKSTKNDPYIKPSIYQDLAFCMEALEKYDEAIVYATKAADITKFYNYLGSLHELKGDLSKAIFFHSKHLTTWRDVEGALAFSQAEYQEYYNHIDSLENILALEK